MSRNTQFLSPARQSLVNNPQAELLSDTVKGPLPGFNPTRARFKLAEAGKTAQPKTPAEAALDEGAPAGVLGTPGVKEVRWSTRDNRKGRHVFVVPRSHTKTDSPKLTTTWRGVGKGIWRMCTVFAWWDVSWWIGMLFSVGSAIFVICGLFYWLPLVAPSTEFPNESLIGGGITAFIGATLFQIGAILLIVEASNENQSGCFGWALERAFSHESNADPEDAKQGAPIQAVPEKCAHHHARGTHNAADIPHPDSGRKWIWWPSWAALRNHYLHEIGFLGSFVLTVGATIFYISGIMALPGIINKISTPVLWGTYWLAYLVGGVFFVISSGFYIIETQATWYTPAPRVIGWWIGVWNMVGSVGWTLSASFGYCSASWCAYQSDLSLVWASVAFLIGSLLLWYEALDKYPVVRE